MFCLLIIVALKVFFVLVMEVSVAESRGVLCYLRLTS